MIKKLVITSLLGTTLLATIAYAVDYNQCIGGGVACQQQEQQALAMQKEQQWREQQQMKQQQLQQERFNQQMQDQMQQLKMQQLRNNQN